MTTRSAAYGYYKNDYLYHDGIEDVEFKKGSGAVQTNVKVKKELHEAATSGVGEDIAIPSDTATWVIWEVTLPDYRIVENDHFIRETGEKWIIESASLQLWDTQWHCKCRKARG